MKQELASIGAYAPVEHVLLRKLQELNVIAENTIRTEHDHGFGRLGLRLDRVPDSSRYDQATPLNCTTFADTGGDGVHFSLLWMDAKVRESSPVVMTVPPVGGNVIVGENLFDFLCCGAERGYFSMDDLLYSKEAKKLYAGLKARPFQDGEDYQQLLQLLKTELGIRPWTDPGRFEELDRRYFHLLELPRNDR